MNNVKSKNLAYIDMSWNGSVLKIVTYGKGDGQLMIEGNKVKTGEIFITKQYLYSLLSFIAGIFKSGLHLKKKK